jgi:hypothetical protein
MRLLPAPRGFAATWLFCFGCCALSYQPAHAQSTFLRKQVVAPGGNESSAAAYALRGTVGQAAIGIVTAAPRDSRQGYWYDGAAGPTAVNDGNAPRPTTLFQNVPNPFNPSTSIRFSLHHAAHVTLTVFDVSGRVVRVVADRPFASGVHAVDFAAEGLASGVYFYRLRAGSLALTRKMVLLK